MEIPYIDWLFVAGRKQVRRVVLLVVESGVTLSFSISFRPASALNLYYLQLILNILWPVLFFAGKMKVCRKQFFLW
jgi:hypothetical protein